MCLCVCAIGEKVCNLKNDSCMLETIIINVVLNKYIYKYHVFLPSGQLLSKQQVVKVLSLFKSGSHLLCMREKVTAVVTAC